MHLKTLPMAALLALGMCLGQENPLTSNHDEDRMNLERYDPLKHAVFAPLFKPGEERAVADFAYVYRNETEKNVMAMTVRWTWTDPSGRKITNDFQTDGFYINAGPVLEPHGLLIVAPGMLLSSQWLSHGYIGPLPNPNYGDELRKSTDVKPTVDTVIYEDGEVVGPDLSETAKSLTARRQVIAELRLTLVGAGSDSAAREQLTRMASQELVPGDHAARWRANIAGSLLHADNPAALLDRIDNLKIQLRKKGDAQ